MSNFCELRSAPSAITVILVSSFLCACATGPQKPETDVAAIQAADQAFYAALSGRSNNDMGMVWADEPYVVNIGPRSKTMDIGWSAVNKYWERVFDFFSDIKVTKTDVKIQTDGKLAWVVGVEHAVLQPKAGGEPVRFDAFATHVFEKENDHWLLVSHHAQVIPR